MTASITNCINCSLPISDMIYYKYLYQSMTGEEPSIINEYRLLRACCYKKMRCALYPMLECGWEITPYNSVSEKEVVIDWYNRQMHPQYRKNT